MRSLVTSKNVSWPRLIWPILYIDIEYGFQLNCPSLVWTSSAGADGCGSVLLSDGQIWRQSIFGLGGRALKFRSNQPQAETRQSRCQTHDEPGLRWTQLSVRAYPCFTLSLVYFRDVWTLLWTQVLDSSRFPPCRRVVLVSLWTGPDLSCSSFYF